MKDYEKSGHITKITAAELSETEETYFIPHQAVIRPDSLTTKLRVVFDASAKTTLGTSLNDKLMPGPNLHNDLIKILLRFRMHQHVITADIAQMFHQIRIDKRDRQLQLILWRNDAKEASHIYQLNTVTYGIASAPYHAIRCLRELAIQHQEDYPIAARAVNEDFYMDDLLSREATHQEVIELQRQLIELLQKGQFLLRKWRSNENKNLQPLLNQPKKNELLILDKDAAKTLGLLWHASKDVLQYKVDLPKQQNLTKRLTLSTIFQIYDPLGLIGPILIREKIFIQKLWMEELPWDKPLPVHHVTAWRRYHDSLSELNALQLSRNVNPDNIVGKIDLFGFGDASQNAFGACLYVVSTDQSGNINSYLLCAKSKVASLKTLSLLRLELEAALLSAQLIHSVKLALHGRMHRILLWSNSTIVLEWIRTEPHALKTFVANRVAKIQELTQEGAMWRHVPSEENPADLLSRGTTVADLHRNSLWWEGPAWIKEKGQCPKQSEIYDTELPEMRNILVALISARSSSAPLLPECESFNKLCRIAYCFRFASIRKPPFIEKRLSKTHKDVKPPEIAELIRAERVIVKWIQKEEFPHELRSL
ncbi:PREDICTED: uncharacterized protein LOC108780075 [Cyphomyrmex costatus]|uniref:uncharacterized protein LOC108780075 n=1 Tax=Cyphomyrmex costatus TaxID=456900 RepID=UPI0008523343|nr:PREDICTED: uncharacterized protein LOC108780075 [Cyphomyrmex costatus]